MMWRAQEHDRQIATRTGKGRWERSTVWEMLRNPAYRGTACYGKTEQRPRQRVTRPLRQRKVLPSRDVGGHERPRAEWIEVPVPALVSEEMFALAQEQLEKNKRHSPRRTIEAIKSLDFVAVAAHQMTPTAEWADIVLPKTTTIEEEEVSFSNSAPSATWSPSQSMARPRHARGWR